MTPRSFWTILIKLAGIYIILQSAISLPEFFSSFYAIATQPTGVDFNGTLITIIYLLSQAVIFGLVFILLIFKTDWVIDKLKLDKDFHDERFEFNIHRSTILKVVVMVIGGLLLIESVPNLFRSVFECFRQTNIYNGFNKNPETRYLILFSLKTLVGYFMLTCSRMIVNFIELKNRRPKTTQ